MNLGTIASIQGKWNRALALYGKSRKRFVEAEDRANLASLYLNEGWSHAARRSWEKARESYLNALQISRNTHNIFRESECYLNLAEVFLATSNLRESRRSCLKALEIFRKIHNQLGIADAYKTLGQLASVERKWGEARIHFEKSISASEGLRHPLFAGRARMEYARMLKDSGSLSEALGEIQKSIAWFEKVEARDDLNSAAELGRELEALRYLERA
jgi:tetratricopeptide (TPR) repeat protein